MRKSSFKSQNDTKLSPTASPPSAPPNKASLKLVEQRLTFLREKAETLRKQRTCLVQQHLDKLANRLVDSIDSPLPPTVIDNKITEIDQDLIDIEASLAAGEQAREQAQAHDEVLAYKKIHDQLHNLQRKRSKLINEIDEQIDELIGQVIALDNNARTMIQACGGRGEAVLRKTQHGNLLRLTTYLAASLSEILPKGGLAQACINSKTSQAQVQGRCLVDYLADLHKVWKNSQTENS